MEELIQQVYQEALTRGCCALFTGRETLPQLFTLFFEPQGNEFCVDKGFPSLERWRQFAGYGVEKYGAFIDSRGVTIRGRRELVLVGDTQAEVHCGGVDLYQIVLLHGARARIVASGYSVVRCKRMQGTTLEVVKQGNAVVLC